VIPSVSVHFNWTNIFIFVCLLVYEIYGSTDQICNGSGFLWPFVTAKICDGWFSAAIHLFECANQITKNISIIFIFTDCIYIFKDKQIVEVITGLFFF
jgi:hypothetical protein